MNSLLDQLKQGLRRIGRGRQEVRGEVSTGSSVNDRGQDTRRRAELDEVPSSPDKGLAPTAPPTGAQSGRTRRAVLSKSRTTAASPSALSFWRWAPVASADKSGSRAPLETASMLAGSSLLQPSTAAAGVLRDRPADLLGGTALLGALHEVAGPQALPEPAPPLSPEDDRADRTSWP